MKFGLPSIALHTDLYQLTMAQGYWRLGLHTRQAVFDLFFRECPFDGGYGVACGLADVIDVIEQYQFSSEDLEYLEKLPAADGTPLFQPDFLQALADLRLSIHMDALLEGTLVFPKEPLLRVQGPLWQCQLLETILLNIVNFSTLIATKASRVCYAAGEDPVIEFGLRRAQGPNGGLMASRAAFIGGVTFTSNVLAGMQYGIGLKGTHAHSWVMSFDSEIEAFANYAKVLPNNCMFLVDTYNTIEGVKHAIEIGRKLQKEGYPFLGIRLDSGDLVSLSIAARELLDNANFKDTKILASNDLDEYRIEAIKTKEAKIDIWGVGTRLVTAYDQPALGGVYKLVSIQNENGVWEHKAKKTDDKYKETMGGIYGLKRIENKGFFAKDVLYKTDPLSLTQREVALENKIEGGLEHSNLLCPIFRKGVRVYTVPDLLSSQSRCKEQLKKLPGEFKCLQPKRVYPIEWQKNIEY